MEVDEENPVEIVHRLLRDSPGLLQNHVHYIINKLKSRSLLTREVFVKLSETPDAKDKVTALFQFVLQEGEEVCQQLLEILEKLQCAFPHSCEVFKKVKTKNIEKLAETLSKLCLEGYAKIKLTLGEILETGPEDGFGNQSRTLADVPWHFLNKILALNVTARNTSLMHDPVDEREYSEQCDAEEFFRNSINPLDVLCVLLHCSDSFLQQEIIQKMSMCQFALPLLLPPCDDPNCTFMLWGMRDIVRKWRPQSLTESKGFMEESLVLTPMPTISFVRLGSCGLSKSMFLNEVLSPPQQHHDVFIHRDMESGNVPRKISDGLVEISWYFPGGRENRYFPRACRFYKSMRRY